MNVMTLLFILLFFFYFNLVYMYLVIEKKKKKIPQVDGIKTLNCFERNSNKFTVKTSILNTEPYP